MSEEDNKVLKAKKKLNTSWWANLAYILSTKSNQQPMLRVESSLELLAVLKLLMNDDVIYVNTDIPSKVIDSIGRRYTEDVEYVDIHRMHHHAEIKNSEALADLKVQTKLNLISKELTSEQSCFEIWDENDICPGQQSKNILRFYRYYHLIFTKNEIEQVLLPVILYITLRNS